MKISFLGQGLENTEKPIGELLIESLKDQEFTEFSCLVAFASSSAVDGLTPHIEESKEHIEKFNVFVGIDQEATSKEALENLLELDIDTQIYHTKSPITFHPKIYIFEGEDKGRVILGSSNITVPGLFQNIESSIVADFEKPDEEGEQLIEEIREYFESFFEGSNQNVNPISEELIEDLVEGETIPQDSDYSYTQTEQEREEQDKSLMKRLRDNFPTVPVNQPSEIFSNQESGKTEPENTDTEVGKGELVWEKELTKTDAQQNSEHPSGQLRFGQAGFEVDGKLIDKNTYFRDNVFGDQNWRQNRDDPDMEIADVPFKVNIEGEDLGIYTLEVIHKPKWESNQNNVPTMLRWGDLMDQIRVERNLTGKKFQLYAPENEGEPFTLEIKENTLTQSL